MRQNDLRLTTEALAALHEVAKGSMQRVLPEHVKLRLVKLGLVRIALGGPMLTDDGDLVVRFGATDASPETIEAIKAGIVRRRMADILSAGGRRKKTSGPVTARGRARR